MKKPKCPGSVSPIMELFVDPYQESDGAIMKRAADGLWTVGGCTRSL